jgi:hypothetical protein
MTKVHLQDPLAGQAAQSEEIERLRNAIEQWKLEEQGWYEQLAEAKQEGERMAAALRKIADMWGITEVTHQSIAAEMRDIARAALPQERE